jgi:hypothetical protein
MTHTTDGVHTHANDWQAEQHATMVASMTLLGFSHHFGNVRYPTVKYTMEIGCEYITVGIRPQGSYAVSYWVDHVVWESRDDKYHHHPHNYHDMKEVIQAVVRLLEK